MLDDAQEFWFLEKPLMGENSKFPPYRKPLILGVLLENSTPEMENIPKLSDMAKKQACIWVSLPDLGLSVMDTET